LSCIITVAFVTALAFVAAMTNCKKKFKLYCETSGSDSGDYKDIVFLDVMCSLAKRLYTFWSNCFPRNNGNISLKLDFLIGLHIIPHFSIDNARIIYTKSLNSLKTNMRSIHLKGMRGKSNVITKLRQKYYLIFIQN
jgi:hypothetical protein